MKKRCILIGAGAAGMSAARRINEYADQIEYDWFEQNDHYGGVWHYADTKQELDENGRPIFHVMYKNLITNLPLNIMTFPGYPADDKLRFGRHQEVLDYIGRFARHFNLLDKIQYCHKILNVKRLSNSWLVTIENLLTEQIFESEYDAVMVCSGRFIQPLIPDVLIPGKHNFKGQIVHTKYYRRPEEFKNQCILVLGGGQSGVEIALDMLPQVRKIYFVHTNNFYQNLPSKIEQIIDGLDKIHEDGQQIILKSGRVLPDVDTVLLGTGYEYHYPFLDETCGVKIPKTGRMEDLYLHFFNITHPTLCIFAIPSLFLPFGFYDHQSIVFIRSLVGEIQLPSKEEMIKDNEKDLLQRAELGIPAKYVHRFIRSHLLWEYEAKLVKLGKLKPLPMVHKKIFDALYALRENDPEHYKKKYVKVLSNGEISFHFPDEQIRNSIELNNKTSSDVNKNEINQNSLINAF